MIIIYLVSSIFTISLSSAWSRRHCKKWIAIRANRKWFNLFDITHCDLGSIETIFGFRMRSYLGHLASSHLPQLHGQVSMALETTGIGVCAINNCSSRSSSLSEQISAGVCDELRFVLRCLCSNVCAEKGVQYCKVTTTCNCWRVMMG